MKSPDQAAFKTILIITVIIAVAMLPLVAKADSHKMHRPLPFSEFDENGDGVVSAEEFADTRASRMAAMAEAGKPMKGVASAPTFSDLDTDNNGVLTEDELVAGQKAHRHAMREKHKSAKGQDMQHEKGMKMPSFGDLDLDGDGCINAEEFAVHQAERHGKTKTQN